MQIRSKCLRLGRWMWMKAETMYRQRKRKRLQSSMGNRAWETKAESETQ